MPARSVSIRHLILGFLAQKPMSGYDIKRDFKSLGWLVGDPSFGSLYPALHGLLRDELVTVDVHPRQNKPPRKVYSITESGSTELAKWADQPQAPNASLKAFVMRLILADNLSEAGLVAHLKQRLAQVAAQRDDLQRATASLDGNADLGHRLALNYGLALATAELDWLESALDGLLHSPLRLEVARIPEA